MNNIKELLERYFEGQTSAEEEATLRRFFSSDRVPAHLEMYSPLFAYFDDEIKITKAEVHSEGSNIQSINKKKMLWISGVAACAAVFAGLLFSIPQAKKCPESGNYVMISGQCYTDVETIRSATLKSLHEVSSDDIEFSEDNSFNPASIIENQLKEFDSFFNE